MKERPRSDSSMRFYLLAGVLAIGAAYAHLLTVIHQQIVSTAGESAWSCGPAEWFDCSRNLASRYSTLLGLPISAYAVGWFLLMLAMLFSGVARGQVDRVLYRMLLFASLPAVAAVLFYAFVSAIILKTFCLYCLGLYLLVALLVQLAIPAAELDWVKILLRARVTAAWSIPVLVFATAIAFERWSVRSESPPSANGAFTTLDSLPRVGPPTAILKLIVFSDFSCGACRAAAKELDRFLARHPGEVQVRLVSFPVHRLDDLTAGRPLPLPDYAASAIGVAMQTRGRFWEYYKGVFLSDRAVDQEFLTEVAENVVGRHELDAVARDIRDPKVLTAVRRNAALARKYNIRRTPSYVVDGKVFAGVIMSDALEAWLSDARERSSSKALQPQATFPSHASRRRD